MIARLATEYAEGRDRDVLARLHSLIRAAGNYSADLDVRPRVNTLLAHGDHAGALVMLRGLMPGAFLSPSTHVTLAEVHRALGDDERADREERIARLALESILDSGDGGPERPWRVLRVSDEYDVLAARGRTSLEQRYATTEAGREVDVHRCDDGSRAWFDIGLLGLRSPSRP